MKKRSFNFVLVVIVIIVAFILTFVYFEQTVWEDRIEAALEPVDCPPVKETEYPDSYYKGPLIDSHFHIGSLPDWGEGPSDYAWLGEKIKIDDIACTLKHDGTVAAFSFFNVWPDIASPSLEVTKLIMERYPKLFVPFIQAPGYPENLYPIVRAPVLKKMLSVYPGLFKGSGEIGLYGEGTPPPDAPLYLENYKLAQEHNLIMYLHLGMGQKESFEKVLQQHPDINFIFHGDTLADVKEEVISMVVDIISNHPNVSYTVDELYGDVWLLRPGVSKEEFLAHFEDYEPLLEKDLDRWKKIIEAYPDKFMWGTDRGDEPIWTYDREVGERLTDYARAFIGRLDPVVQEKFAYKNAEKSLQDYSEETDGGSVAICVDCAPGHIGGGCTYVDKNTGETVQPKGCFQYDTRKEKHFCSDESRKADACIEIYQPVCGSDARTYSNSCFACINQNVFFYLEGECSEVTQVTQK